MHPVHYFDVFVEGNFYDLNEHRYCLRRAFNACVSTSHMADIYFNYCERNQKDIVNEFKQLKNFIIFVNNETNNKFKDIRSISNAFKHLYLDDDAHATISSGGVLSTIELDPEDSNIIELTDAYEAKNNRSFIQYTKKNNDVCELLPILESVNNYWSDLIYT